MLEYLKGTKHIKLTLEVGDRSMIHWFILTLHIRCMMIAMDTQGGTMTIENEAVTSISRGQKKNTKISTEFKVVGTDDILP